MKREAMKEIDFIPEWYKASLRKKVGYKRQYIVLATVFAGMTVGVLMLGLSVSSGQEILSHTRGLDSAYGSIEGKYERLKSRVDAINSKKTLMDRIDPMVNFAAVVAEITHLTPANIIFADINISAEAVKDNSRQSSRMVLLRTPTTGQKPVLPDGIGRYKLTASGIGADAGHVTMLVSNLKGSAYFRKITLGFMRNKNVKGHVLTEFEISCYLANDVQQKKSGQ